jgi:hypothetical protein
VILAYIVGIVWRRHREQWRKASETP